MGLQLTVTCFIQDYIFKQNYKQKYSHVDKIEYKYKPRPIWDQLCLSVLPIFLVVVMRGTHGQKYKYKQKYTKYTNFNQVQIQIEAHLGLTLPVWDANLPSHER